MYFLLLSWAPLKHFMLTRNEKPLLWVTTLYIMFIHHRSMHHWGRTLNPQQDVNQRYRFRLDLVKWRPVGFYTYMMQWVLSIKSCFYNSEYMIWPSPFITPSENSSRWQTAGNHSPGLKTQQRNQHRLDRLTSSPHHQDRHPQLRRVCTEQGRHRGKHFLPEGPCRVWNGTGCSRSNKTPSGSVGAKQMWFCERLTEQWAHQNTFHQNVV